MVQRYGEARVRRSVALSVLELSIDVDAPLERVWEVIADPRNLTRWDRHIVRVDGLPADGLVAGSTYTVVVRFFGVTAHAECVVTDLDVPGHAEVEVDGVVEAKVQSWVTPLDGGRTRIRHRVDYRFPGGPLGTIAAQAFQMLGGSTILRRGLQEQKRQAEEA
jgi:uncharacterized membrane protein